MDSNLVSRITGSEDDVIDLDGAENTPEEIIYEWDAKIRKKLSMFAVADNENILGDLMQEYLQSLQEMARIYEDNISFKNKVFCHVSFLYSYYVELQCCTPDNYLTNMEDILTLYCNMELEIIRPVNKKNFSKREYKRRKITTCRRIIHTLTLFLLERHDHILHVLIKMNTKNITDSCSEVLNVLYTHFLTKVPAFNLCDESFCRSYILFQKWKEIRKKEDWEGMDNIMYKMFNRTPESIKNSPTLKQILTASSQSPVGIVLNLFRSFEEMSNAYFKHITAQRNTELEDLDFNIDLGEDEPTLTMIEDQENEEEDVVFLKTYYEVERNMSNLPKNAEKIVEDIEQIKCKQEIEEDDDVEYIDTESSPPQEKDFKDNELPPCRTLNFMEAQPSKEQDRKTVPAFTTPIVPISGADSENHVATAAEETTITPTPSSDTVIASDCENVAENQPEVSLVSNTIVPSTLSSLDDLVSDKSAEKNHVYNDYGLTTPPFDVSAAAATTDGDSAPCPVYTTCLQQTSSEKVSEKAETAKNCTYNDCFGLTPPNDDDHNARVEQTCLYTNIGTNHDKEKPQQEEEPVQNMDKVTESSSSQINNNCDTLPNNQEETKVKVAHAQPIEQDWDPEESDAEEIDVDTCHETADKDIPLEDTGQKAILNPAPNIKESPPETVSTFNGGTILKPLVSSNRTNGQTKEVVSTTSSKIVYTSSQKINTPLDDFSKFENSIQLQWSKMKENHDLEEILSGPVTKLTPTKHNNFRPQDRLDIFSEESTPAKANSRSNSPTEMTSPAYEGIDDFKNYFSDRVNGKVPQGILKKGNSTSSKRKNFRIMFHESTCDHHEERRSDGVMVPKRVRRDRKLNMEPRVVMERLSFIENKMKKILNNPPTLRVDYDKTTRHINEKDVVRCISPPRFSWLIKSYDLSRSKHNSGKVKALDYDDYGGCNQLAEEFTKLNCTEDEGALNLVIPEDPESEFSNSPVLLHDSSVVEKCLEETSKEINLDLKKNAEFLCDNSNFYKSETCLTSNLSNVNNADLIQLPTAVPESYDFEKNLKNEVFTKVDWQTLDDSDGETRLPLKKRKLSSVPNKNDDEEPKKEEISYPATPMISIAEVEASLPSLRKLQVNTQRPFKTPAERKEMPPLPTVFYNVDSAATDPSPIITDQFNINNHTYNNPTINYHMNNVPVPFINIPCGSYYSLPPILVPFNNATFDQSKLNHQQELKKETKKQGRRRRHQ